MTKATVRGGSGRAVGAFLPCLIVCLAGCAATLENGPPARPSEECEPEQVEVMLLGTFHFDQQNQIDVLRPDRQQEIEGLLDALAGDDRLFMVVGGSHVPVLRQILDLTPQLCAVDVLPYLSAAATASSGSG